MRIRGDHTMRFKLFLTALLILSLFSIQNCRPRKKGSRVSAVNYDDPAQFNQKINNPALQNVHWKLLFHQIFAANIGRYNDGQKNNLFNSKEEILKRFIYFHPKNINESYTAIIEAGKKAGKAGDATAASKTENELYHEKIASELNDSAIFNQYLSDEARVQYLDRYLPHANAMMVGPLVQSLKGSGTANGGRGFWDSADGQLVDQLMRGWVMVLVPGFGSHNMDDRIFPEMAHENPGTGFTILHPSPSDLGNTFTDDETVAVAVLRWLERVRSAGIINDNTKFIFVGYSKGAPVVHEMLRQAKAGGAGGGTIAAIIARNTYYMVTLGGVVQGTPVAGDGLSTLQNETNQLPDSMKEALSIFDIMNMKLTPELILSLKDQLGGFFKAIEFLGLRGDQVSNMLNRLDGVNLNDIIAGVEDMSTKNRTEWNLKYLNDASLGTNHPITFMSVGAIANVDDFILPGPSDTPENRLEPPTTLPQVYFAGGMLYPDFKKFSMDDLFLWLTSVDAFNVVSGRLFDTQVPVMDTKSPFLDKRPLQLTGISNSQVNLNAPRADVFSGLDNAKTLDFIDLGEIRHSHWFPIAQVFNPSNLLVNAGEVYKSPFPRSAFLASIIETIALYHALSDVK